MSSASCWTNTAHRNAARDIHGPSDRHLNWDGQLTYYLRRIDTANGRRTKEQMDLKMILEAPLSVGAGVKGRDQPLLPFVKRRDSVAVNSSVTTSGLAPLGGDTGAKRAVTTLFRRSETSKRKCQESERPLKPHTRMIFTHGAHPQ